MNIANLCERHAQYKETKKRNDLSKTRLDNIVKHTEKQSYKIRAHVEKTDIGNDSAFDWGSQIETAGLDEEFSQLLESVSKDRVIDQSETDELKFFIESDLGFYSEFSAVSENTDKLISGLAASGVAWFRESQNGQMVAYDAIHGEVSSVINSSCKDRVRKLGQLRSRLDQINQDLGSYAAKKERPVGYDVVASRVSSMADVLRDGAMLLKNVEEILVCFRKLHEISKVYPKKYGKEYFPGVFNDALKSQLEGTPDLEIADIQSIISTCEKDALQKAQEKKRAHEKNSELKKYALIGLGSIVGLVLAWFLLVVLWETFGFWLIIGAGVGFWVAVKMDLFD